MKKHVNINEIKPVVPKPTSLVNLSGPAYVTGQQTTTIAESVRVNGKLLTDKEMNRILNQ